MFRNPAWAVGSCGLAAQQLPKLSELSQLGVFTILMGHPVVMKCYVNQYLTSNTCESPEEDEDACSDCCSSSHLSFTLTADGLTNPFIQL